jgi:hypothetical protein
MFRNKKQSKQNVNLIQALRGEEQFNVEEEIVVLKDEISHQEQERTQQEHERDNEEKIDEADENENFMKRKAITDEDEEEEKKSGSVIADDDDEDYDFDVTKLASIEDMEERAKYIPLRLSYEERKSLRLVNAAINVSDYTNSVDVEFKSKSKRRHMQLQNICGFLSGVISASSYEEGQKVLQDRNFCDYESFLKVPSSSSLSFSHLFVPIKTTLEISRRYKVMNPEKMRSEYGKLVFLIQDAVSPEIQSLLGVNIHQPIHTVYDLLASKGGLKLLADPRISVASQEIYPDKNKTRGQLDAEIKKKEKAARLLIKEYETHRLSSEDIRQCLYSICDNNSFLNSNCRPIEECIELLQHYFSPNKISPGLFPIPFTFLLLLFHP